MTILENVSLKPYNTFGIEARARYFAEINSIDELKESILFARNNQLRYLVLGGGSNILLTKDVDGLVIYLHLKGIEKKIIDENKVRVYAKSSEIWHEFVLFCLENDFGGLENLSIIPGKAGTSPVQNIGAYGVEMKDCFVSCQALNTETLELETLTKEQCQFGYRDSYFKKEGKGKYIITEVCFELTRKEHQLKISYGAIQEELSKLNILHPSIQDVSKAVIKIRQSKLPDPKITGNAGSFFKNPVVPIKQYENLKNLYPKIPGYANKKSVKIPAGWLIEQLGWKGQQIGNVATHALQALVIINATGQATGKEVYDFSSKIIESVEQKFGITLEREVNIW